MTLTQSGIRRGELYIMSTPRQTGKSIYYDIETLLKNREYMDHEPKIKYQFSRANWYEVRFSAMTLYGVLRERLEWCDATFGKEPKVPDAWCRWYSGPLFIRFRDAQDYEWYMLRWS